MSFTTELNDPQSVLRQFIDRRFGHLAVYCRYHDRLLDRAETLLPETEISGLSQGNRR